MSGYATLKANNFNGLQTMTGLKVKGSPTAYVDVQSAPDYYGNVCGVRYLPSSGSPKYQSTYTPSDGIFGTSLRMRRLSGAGSLTG